jgi:hypothetical protein
MEERKFCCTWRKKFSGSRMREKALFADLGEIYAQEWFSSLGRSLER